MDKGIKDIYRLIKKYDVITIYGHVNPDCDCYGSSLGLREILRTNFKKKKIYSLGYGTEAANIYGKQIFLNIVNIKLKKQ